jgi:hypothetical protein
MGHKHPDEFAVARDLLRTLLTRCPNQFTELCFRLRHAQFAIPCLRYDLIAILARIVISSYDQL